MLGNCVIDYRPQKMLVDKVQPWADSGIAFRKTGLSCQISNSIKTQVSTKEGFELTRKENRNKYILMTNEFK